MSDKRNITVTHIDDSNINEKIGSKEKVEFVHEKLYKDFNIDPTKAYDGTVLKQIPHEWLPDIVSTGVEIAKKDLQIIEIQNNLQNKSFLISFDNIQNAEEFSKRINIAMFNSINTVIENKKFNPKHYHRSIIVTTKLENNTIILQY